MANPHLPRSQSKGLLDGARVYLSGPMDFVASREEEMQNGWRTRVSAFLRSQGCTVFDPWQKPAIRGLQEYGREGLDTSKTRDACGNSWTRGSPPQASQAPQARRSRPAQGQHGCCDSYQQSGHIRGIPSS